MNSALFIGVLLLTLLYVLIRCTGPTIGLLLADPIVANVVGYTVAVRVICLTHPGICLQPLAFLSDVVAVSTLLPASLLALLFGLDRSARLGVSRWPDLRKKCRWNGREQRIHGVLLVLCAVISLVFIFAVLSSSGLGVDLHSLLTGETSLLDVRKAISQGANVYFAPGYLKQIRDILFPVICGTFLMFGIKKGFRLAFVIGGLVVLAAMLISGQRTPLLLLFVVIGVSLYVRYPHITAGRTTIIVAISVLALTLFFFSTVMLGRTAEDRSITSNVLEAVVGIVERVFGRAAWENMVTAPVWWPFAPTMGLSWMRDLSAVLPGTQRLLSTSLHEGLGGSDAGNSVLGLPADLYFAWGWPGALVVPWIYILLTLPVDRYFFESRSPFAKALKIYVTFAALQWFSPYLFILNGGLFVLLLVPFHYLRKVTAGRV